MLRLVKALILSLLVLVPLAHGETEEAPIHIALDDLPGVDMLPILIAVERAKERGLSIKVSYMLSEGMAMSAILRQQADIGMGTPYQKIQKMAAPIRMFYQLNMLRFHPVVDTRYYSNWNELDGVAMYSHGEGSGTEALVNMLAKLNGIKYSKMVYLPGSGVRANAMINERIHATVVDTERKNSLLAIPGSPFKVLPMDTINASDEALYANEAFLSSHEAELKVFVEELLFVWRSMNTNSAYILEQRNKYGLLPELNPEKVSKYFQEVVDEGTFPNDGGRSSAFEEDIKFYGFAGTIKDPSSQKMAQYWDFSILDQIQTSSEAR